MICPYCDHSYDTRPERLFDGSQREVRLRGEPGSLRCPKCGQMPAGGVMAAWDRYENIAKEFINPGLLAIAREKFKAGAAEHGGEELRYMSRAAMHAEIINEQADTVAYPCYEVLRNGPLRYREIYRLANGIYQTLREGE